MNDPAAELRGILSIKNIMQQNIINHLKKEEALKG